MAASSAASGAVRPIIAGFYPDPSVCRVGEDYYLANSSFEYVPGVPLWHSRDLVTWTEVGNAFEAGVHLAAGSIGPGRGVFAPTLRHRGDTWYLITTRVDHEPPGQTLVTASSPEGPWSAPVILPDIDGIDPDLAWDDEGVALVSYCTMRSDLWGIAQAAVDLETGRALEEPRLIWQGTGMANPEGPHLYRIGDWWYLLIAEGGTERGHSVSVARSRSPRGPFEAAPSHPILSHRSTTHPVQNTGHADLVQAADGSWALVYLGVRPAGYTPSFHVNGRETFIAGIDWVDGWPVVDEDRFKVPAPPHAFDDAFEGQALHTRWVSPGFAPASVTEPADAGVTLVHRDAPSAAWSGLYVRTRDPRWQVIAAVVPGDGIAGVGVRLDNRHWCEVRVGDGVARAVARIGPLKQQLGECAVVHGEVEVAIRAIDSLTDGPDDLELSVRAGGEDSVIGRIDGRYLSTEVASGFTGRVVGVRAVRGRVRLASVSYQPAD